MSEHSQDGYRDSAIESVDTVPRAYNSSGVEADEDDPDAWGKPSADPSLIDVVCDDSKIVAGNTGREIVLIHVYVSIFFQLMLPGVSFMFLAGGQLVFTGEQNVLS